jgi:hypothetical protein
MGIKNGMRPVHPGEILREDFLRPAGMSVNALAKALHVPTPRINDVVRGRRGPQAPRCDSRDSLLLATLIASCSRSCLRSTASLLAPAPRVSI